MRRGLLSILVPCLFTVFALAQTTALPGYGSRMNTNDHTAREVMHELLMLPYYSVFDNLAFSVNGDTVTLMGEVVNASLKSDSEARVKKIEGVQKVVNNIEVLPPSPMDDRIRREVFRSVFGSAGLYRYAMGAVPSIHIIVNRGHVKLVGVVDNEGDRNIANIQAKSVPGVFSVEDDLQVMNKKMK